MYYARTLPRLRKEGFFKPLLSFRYQKYFEPAPSSPQTCSGQPDPTLGNVSCLVSTSVSWSWFMFCINKVAKHFELWGKEVLHRIVEFSLGQTSEMVYPYVSMLQLRVLRLREMEGLGQGPHE